MEKNKEKELDTVIGCGLAAWSLCITTPIWLVLLFVIMQHNDMPTWAWVLYWVYLPTCLLGIISAAIARPLLKG